MLSPFRSVVVVVDVAVVDDEDVGLPSIRRHVE